MLVIGMVIACYAAAWLCLLPLPVPPQYYNGIVLPRAGRWFADSYLSMCVNMACTGGIGLLMSAINRTFSLHRTQTALDSSMFLAMMLAMPTLLMGFNTGTLLALVVLVCMFLLYGTYADPGATRPVFLIFLLLSAMSMTQYSYLIYVPVFIVGVMQMRIFTARALTACVLGLITPWWILGALSLAVPVRIDIPDFSLFLTAFSLQDNLKLIITVAFIGLLTVGCWVLNVPQMIAYNAHRRAYNGTLSVVSLATLLSVLCDFSNFSVYAPLLAVCASFQLGRLLGGRPTRGNVIAAYTLLAVFLLIFLCYPVRLILS